MNELLLSEALKKVAEDKGWDRKQFLEHLLDVLDEVSSLNFTQIALRQVINILAKK